jgi:hypothetical protein
MSTPSTPKRKPAAQPGHRNAFRHGLYSKYLTRADMHSLDENDDTKLMTKTALSRFILIHLLIRMDDLLDDESYHLS